ncbi:hypothetical protein NDU88_004708 [Pleurodeles waltl]|uniref:Uncharacterized protein n=1 Tax=Pleurodeles waltl TaxID=8319 RepID=A0AAV7W5R2_PLEWA|nr:hypothetical protein NDU88_004708 [Pleurodeles waltl]
MSSSPYPPAPATSLVGSYHLLRLCHMRSTAITSTGHHCPASALRRQCGSGSILAPIPVFTFNIRRANTCPGRSRQAFNPAVRPCPRLHALALMQRGPWWQDPRTVRSLTLSSLSRGLAPRSYTTGSPGGSRA